VERSTKEAIVTELRELFSSVVSAVLVDPKGLSANKAVELRKELDQTDSKMRIVKNTLAIIALEGTPFEGMKEQFLDTRALVFSYKNAIGPAKVVSGFAKRNEALQVKMGLLRSEGKFSLLQPEEVNALANLPSKEELAAKLLFLFNAPIFQFVRALNEIPAKFVRTLSAIADAKNNVS
jgi:large subunit ribosomal protein L10